MSAEAIQITIDEAKRGSAHALNHLVVHCQNKVHRLSLRMVVDPDVAEDATQEILIRVVTKLSTFRGEASFDTWVSRIAINYLLTATKIRRKDPGLTFSMFADDLLDGLADEDTRAPDEHVLLNQLRIKCTMAMLMCLDAKHRAAYVLGEVLEFDHADGADVLGVSRDTFRKQVSRARSKVVDFTRTHCGLVGEDAPCSCPRRLLRAIEIERVSHADTPAFADAPSYEQVKLQAQALSEDLRAAKLQRSTGDLRAPKYFGEVILQLIDPP